jgi:hypothetical protein
VPADEALSETVVFELLNRGGAKRLCERLRPRRHGRTYGDGEGALVSVELQPQEGGLAVLLRLRRSAAA